MFEIEASKLPEILVRVTLIYLGCMVLLRAAGRREMSELNPMDLVTMLLISETVSPALTGGDESVIGGVFAATILILLSVLTSWLVFRSRRAERVIQGGAAVLIRDGKVRPGILRRFQITDEDLRASLHKQGLLSVSDVARAFVEADGEVTIVKRADHEKSLERAHASD